MTRIIYRCPECLSDLEDEGATLWCPSCEASVPYAVLAPEDDGDTDDNDD